MQDICMYCSLQGWQGPGRAHLEEQYAGGDAVPQEGHEKPCRETAREAGS